MDKKYSRTLKNTQEQKEGKKELARDRKVKIKRFGEKVVLKNIQERGTVPLVLK